LSFFKDSDWDKTPWEMLKLLDTRIHQTIFEILEGHIVEIFTIINECESPIEQLFGVTFQYIVEKRRIYYDPGLIILPQSSIECYGKKYRVDFLVLVGDFIYNPDACKKFVIECDGHDFHEKTKLQAAKDKQRDRHMTGAGYHIIRFTGSEIWKNPFKCAREAAEIIQSNCLD